MNAASGVRSTIPRRGFRHLAFLACAVLFAPCLLTAQPAALDLQLAAENATVTTTARREFVGLLDGFRDGRLHIRAATGGGEVGYSFAPGEIAQLVLPGAEIEAQAVELWERGHVSEALPLLEAIGRQRMRYLPVLTNAHREPLWLLVRASMQAGNPLATLRYVTELRPHTADTAIRALLRDAELDAHVQLGHAGEINRLAAAWCAEADPAGGSALGWKILAQRAHDTGDFAQARWTALQPIVFSGYLPMEYLDTCYALAISAAHQLQEPAHAAALFREMQERRITWPTDPTLAPIHDLYSRDAVTPSTAPGNEEANDPPAASAPVADPGETLDSVRKLIGPTS